MIIRSEKSNKNDIFRYYYFYRKKLSITSKLKKNIVWDFLKKKLLKKMRLLLCHRLHTWIHTYPHILSLFFKSGFLSSWCLKMCLYAKKSKFHLSQWFLYMAIRAGFDLILKIFEKLYFIAGILSFWSKFWRKKVSFGAAQIC